MDQIFEQLGGLFLSSLPSVFLLIVLYFFLKSVLFNPLEKILAERYQKTEGKEKGASEAIRLAEKRAEEHARALQDAKSQIYAQQEALRKNLEAEHDAAIATSAALVSSALAEGRQAVEEQLQESQAVVQREASGLARLIADKVLFRGAA